MRTNSEKGRKNGKSFIEQKLNNLSIEKLSKESEFSKRKAKKITAKDFLLGFFLMANSRENHSYQNWAIKIGLIIKGKVSKQALWKKMRDTQIIFLKKVLSKIIKDSLRNKSRYLASEKLKVFRNVIVEDSTNIKLDEKLHEEYPGNEYWDKSAKKSIMKLQASYEITGGKFIRLDVTSFRENDQGYSSKIVEIAKRGDLVIRDLGYFILKVFKKLNQEGIFFISRMKKRINVYSRENETVIDLAKMLKKRGNLDIEIFVGEKEKLPVRLIALPVEEEVANKRRRKAKTNRDKRCNPNKEHLYLLGWELFITNVDKDILDPIDIAQLYFIRWRIEIIFKSWKSYFRITDIPKDANKIRTESYIYCMLIFIILFQVYYYNFFLTKNNKASKKLPTREISLLLFMQYITKNIEFIFLCRSKNNYLSQDLLFEHINYYCRYESRQDRYNFSQKFMKLG